LFVVTNLPVKRHQIHGVDEVSKPIAAQAQRPNESAIAALQMSAVAWFIPTLLGQWLFAYHIVTAYVVPAMAGDFASWNKRLFVGLIPGDLVGNVALGVHLFVASILTVSGTLQLVPQIRTHAPVLHRWSGRLYALIAVVTSFAALYMIWTRDTFGGILVNDIAVSIDALLIIAFTAITLRYAIARKIDIHNRWALRTFMVVSGVWFKRMIYAFLGAIIDKTPGLTDDMTGPTNTAIEFASYLLPLVVLEFYLLAKRTPNATAKFAAATLVFAASAATSIGVYRTAARMAGLAP
jgi:Predicted membrane protein (DUF2306)